MSTLKFILGPASKDHQQALVQELHQQLVANPNDQFFFLVPNHIKFSTEIDVLNQLKNLGGSTEIYAQSRVQVLSFTRLAWFLLRNDPHYQTPRISDVGLTMLVAKIIRELPEDDLKMFAKEAHRYGFVQDLTAQLIELQNANVAPQDHDAIIERVQKWADEHQERVSSAFLDKMTVLFKVYAAFEQGLTGRLNSSAVYQLLIKRLAKDDFSHTHFFLNRYNGQFSAMEEQIVETMIKKAASTTIGLVLDRPYRGATLPNPNNLFYQSGMQYHRLAEFAEQQPDVILVDDQVVTVNRVSDGLAEVEEWMKAQAQFTVPEQQPRTDQGVHFFTAPTRVAELQRVAAKIRQLVASGQYRYRDFLILTRHLDGYTTMLKPVFDANEVPIFNDNDRSMANHPLVTLLEAIFKIADRHFQLPDILQLLKTGLVVPQERDEKGQSYYPSQRFMSAVYTTENWCLKYGKTGHAWLEQREWKFTPHVDPQILANNEQLKNREQQQTNQINWVKSVVRDQIAPFIKQLQGSSDGQTAAHILYQGLINLGVREQLEQWAKAATKRGQMDLAQQPQQVWNTMVNLLDEYVTVLGNEGTFDLTEFAEIIQVGFQTATYSQIPSTMDQVLVSETGIVQTNQRKVVFMIGATDDVMPEIKISEGLLSDPDKQLLSQGLADGQFLPVSGMQRIDNEAMLNYLGMLNAREQLYLSAPAMGSNEERVTMSPYLVGLATYFGQWNADNNQLRNDLPFAPEPRADFAKIKPFVSAPAATLTNYVQVERQAKNVGQTVSAGWRNISREMNHERLGWLKSSLNYQNQTTKLSPEMAAKLYGHLDPDVLKQATAAGDNFDWTTVSDDQRHNTLATSISQLQTFYRNPYEYFLKFGLDLQKREELEITNANSGTFYHDSLEAFVRLLKQNQIKLAELADDQLAFYVAKAMDWAFSRQPSVVELAANYERIAYQKHHLEQTVLTMARVLRNQAQYSASHPVTTEQKFGHVGLLDDRHDSQPSYRALIYETKIRNQKSSQPDLKRKVYLRGRIDRVDAVRGDQQDYLTVVDYKSANKEFDLVDAYEGLDLQMLTYLNNLQANLDIANPDRQSAIAGALYLHLFDPHYQYKNIIKKNPEITELQNHEFKGILLNDDAILRQIDEGLAAEKPNPLVLGVSYTKSKDLIKAKKGSLLVDQEQLKRLLARNKQLIIAAAQQIFSGNVELKPFRRDQRTGLDYSDYLDIYHFDNLLDQDKYREIILTDDDVMQKLKDEGADNE